MTSSSNRLQWALAIAVGLHLLLAGWLSTGLKSRQLPAKGSTAASSALPSVVQVAPMPLPPPKPAALPAPISLPPPPTVAPALAQQEREQLQAVVDAQLQLAAERKREPAPVAVTPPAPPPPVVVKPAGVLKAPLASRLAAIAPPQQPKARAKLPPLEPVALARLAATPPPAPKPQPKPQIAVKPAAKPVPKPPPSLAALAPKPGASRPAPVKKPSLPPVKLAQAKVAAAPAAKPAAPAAKPAARPAARSAPQQPTVIVRRQPPAAARSAPGAMADSTRTQPAGSGSEPVYQLPSGKLSLRLANPPPRMVTAASSGSGLAVEAAALPVEPERIVAALPQATVPLVPTRLPADEPPLPPAATLGATLFPPVTIFAADDSPPAAEPPPPPLAAPAGNPRGAYFQGVTTLLKAANAQALADALSAGKKLVVRMKFAVKRDGSLVRIGAALPTPDWAVAEAAKVIRAAAPFPAVPGELPGKTVELSYPVEIYAQ